MEKQWNQFEPKDHSPDNFKCHTRKEVERGLHHNT